MLLHTTKLHPRASINRLDMNDNDGVGKDDDHDWSLPEAEKEHHTNARFVEQCSKLEQCFPAEVQTFMQCFTK